MAVVCGFNVKENLLRSCKAVRPKFAEDYNKTGSNVPVFTHKALDTCNCTSFPDVKMVGPYNGIVTSQDHSSHQAVPTSTNLTSTW